LAIQPEGADKVSWKATTATNSPWLTLKTTAADAPGTLSLMLQPGTLAEGEYEDTVVVTATGFEDRPVRIPVTFTVRAAPYSPRLHHPADQHQGRSVISPAVTVTARDAAGRTLTTWNGAVTMSIATNPAAGTLSGTLTVTASGGIARFANLAIDRTGNGYVLRATSGAVSTTSAAFNITSKGVSGSVSTVAASATTISASNGSSSTTITVTVRDDQGGVVPGAQVNVAASGTANNLGPTAGSPTGRAFLSRRSARPGRDEDGLRQRGWPGSDPTRDCHGESGRSRVARVWRTANQYRVQRHYHAGRYGRSHWTILETSRFPSLAMSA